MSIKHGLHIEIAEEFLALRPWLCAMKEHFQDTTTPLHAVRNVIKKYDVGEYCFAVKSFQIPNIINRFVYAYLRMSKAKRSYKNATLLRSKGINTPKPVAWLEWYRHGMLQESYYISLYEPADATGHELWKYTEQERVEITQELVRYTVQNLHKNKVLHLDFSPGNILIARDESKRFCFSFVDLNRMKETPVGFLQGLENFSRLREEQMPIIAREYALLHGKNTFEEQENVYCQLRDMFERKKRFVACRNAWKAFFMNPLSFLKK